MWTKEKPTKPGYYWYRWGAIVKIIEGVGATGTPLVYRFVGSEFENNAELMIGDFWSEPVQPPQQAEPLFIRKRWGLWTARTASRQKGV